MANYDDLIYENDYNKPVTPQAITIEKGLLGAMLLSPTAADEVFEILGAVTEERSPFYLEKHTWIFLTMIRMHAEQKEVDLLTLCNVMKEESMLERVGGAQYLASLTENVVTTAHVRTWCRIIQQKYMHRESMASFSEGLIEMRDESKDIFEILSKAESRIYDLSEMRFSKSSKSIAEIAQIVHQAQFDISTGKKKIEGIQCGLMDIDAVTGGWQKNDLIIIAGRPSQGKTALSLHIAKHTVKEEKIPVAFFSVEMGEDQLVQRIISTEGNFNLQQYKRGEINQAKAKEALAAVSKWPLYIDDTSGITPMEMKAKARRLKQKHGIGLVIVDYIGLMESGKDFQGNREREVAYISKNLKGMAKELQVPVIALSQLNRGVESRGKADKEPQLSDLRESGAIEQDADLVMAVWRPESYGLESTPFKRPAEGMMCVPILKQRNGPLGAAEVVWDGATQRIKNYAFSDDLMNRFER